MLNFLHFLINGIRKPGWVEEIWTKLMTGEGQRTGWAERYLEEYMEERFGRCRESIWKLWCLRIKSGSVEIKESNCTCGCIPTCQLDECAIHSINYLLSWLHWDNSCLLRKTIHSGCVIFITSLKSFQATHVRLQFNPPCDNGTVNMPWISWGSVRSYCIFAGKILVKDALKLSPALCVYLPSLEVFHELGASTLASWGNSDPGKRRKDEY